MTKDALLALIRRIHDGERDAYAGIVTAHQGMLLAYAGFRLPDRDLADEVVQQTFIRAYEQIRDFRPDGDFGTWLRTICKFLILAELKRRSREQRNLGNARDVLRQTLFEEGLRGDGEEDPLQRLQGCLDRLATPQRDLLAHRYRDGESVNELALRYKRKVTWVTTVLFRLRGLLRTCMERGVGA